MPITLTDTPAAAPQRQGGPPRLRLRRIAIDTYHEAVAYLPRRCTVLRPEDFQALAKIEIHNGHRRIMAVLNIVEQEEMLRPDEIGLSQHAFALLGAPEGTLLGVQQASMPGSLDAIRAKLRGEELSAGAIAAIVRDIAEYRYSKMEIAAFLIASASFLSTREVLDLTRAMADAGNRLDWPEQNVVDKHCIGGIPGNRTSMIIVPIVAAHGLLIPKTSSRAITSPAGTADTMEVLTRVDLEIDEMREVVSAERGCLVWGGHVNLSPADDVLISVERPLAIDTREQMVASILSKKLAAGSRRLVIDLPVGPTAKVRSKEEAIRLRKLFEHVGDRVGLDIDVLVTDGTQPVGRGIGPVLEARDVMQVLERRSDAPADLRERALLIAGHLLEFDPDLRGGKGLERARALLDSGAALRKMQSIIARQGPSATPLVAGPLVQEVKASADGVVGAIDCFRLARLARIAGAPLDKGAGVDLFHKVGDRVEEGEPLYRIHACLASNYALACGFAEADSGIRLDRTQA